PGLVPLEKRPVRPRDRALRGRREVRAGARAGVQKPGRAFPGSSSTASFMAFHTSRKTSAAYFGSLLFSPPIAPRTAFAVISTAFSNNAQSTSRATWKRPPLDHGTVPEGYPNHAPQASVEGAFPGERL